MIRCWLFGHVWGPWRALTGKDAAYAAARRSCLRCAADQYTETWPPTEVDRGAR
jgi:hypothetical protein